MTKNAFLIILGVLLTAPMAFGEGLRCADLFEDAAHFDAMTRKWRSPFEAATSDKKLLILDQMFQVASKDSLKDHRFLQVILEGMRKAEPQAVRQGALKVVTKILDQNLDQYGSISDDSLDFSKALQLLVEPLVRELKRARTEEAQRDILIAYRNDNDPRVVVAHFLKSKFLFDSFIYDLDLPGHAHDKRWLKNAQPQLHEPAIRDSFRQLLVAPLTSARNRRYIAEEMGRLNDKATFELIMDIAKKRPVDLGIDPEAHQAIVNASLGFFAKTNLPTAEAELMQLFERGLEGREFHNFDQTAALMAFSERRSPNVERAIVEVLYFRNASMFTRAGVETLKSALELAGRHLDNPSIKALIEQYAAGHLIGRDGSDLRFQGSLQDLARKILGL